jgi:hypothetical protein
LMSEFKVAAADVIDIGVRLRSIRTFLQELKGIW